MYLFLSSDSPGLVIPLPTPDVGSCPSSELVPLGCIRLEPGVGSGFELPRRDALPIPANGIASVWAVYVCNASDASEPRGGWHGSLRVHRLISCDAGALLSRVPPITSEPATVQHAGPDDLWAEAAGPEWQRLSLVHEGCCRYVAPLQMALPGRYRLRVLPLYRGWAALDEQGAGGGWASPRHFHWDDALGNDTALEVTLGSGSASGEWRMRILRNLGDAAVGRPSAQALELHARLLSGAGLPPCASASGPLAVAGSSGGRWLHRDLLAWSSRALERKARDTWPFRRSLSPQELAWAPAACARGPPPSPADARRVLSEAGPLFFRGDSHMRNFFERGILRPLGGYAGPPLDATTKHGKPERCFRVRTEAGGAKHTNVSAGAVVEGASTWCYHMACCGNASFAPAEELGLHRWTLVANFGNWNCAALQQPLTVYRALLKAYFLRVLDALARGNARRFVWIRSQNIGPLPLSRVANGDWRSPARLEAFNVVADEELASAVAAAPAGTTARVHVIDAARLSWAVAGLGADGMHCYLKAFHGVLAEQLLAVVADRGWTNASLPPGPPPSPSFPSYCRR